MLLMIDNYDSFTYNVVQYLQELGANVRTARNDSIEIADIEQLAPERIVISPGPGTPAQSGICLELIRRFAGHVPILGICLGHQSICEALGGRIVRAERIMHGKTSMIRHRQQGVFTGLPSPFEATRYHSLIMDPASTPDCLEVTAWCWADDRPADGDEPDRPDPLQKSASPGEFDPSASAGDTAQALEIMGVRHTSLPLEGVQFHPESIMTRHGHELLRNFLQV